MAVHEHRLHGPASTRFLWIFMGHTNCKALQFDFVKEITQLFRPFTGTSETFRNLRLSQDIW